MPAPRAALFAYHANEGAFERLAPPWERIEVVRSSGGIRDGGALLMRIRKGPVAIPWEALHFGYIEGERFCDEQVRGPFARWVHTHSFEPAEVSDRSTLQDHVEWAVPGGAIGNAIGGGIAARQLDRMFAFRHLRTARDLLRHQSHAARGTLRIVVTGASGSIGSALVPYLTSAGHEVTRLVRREPVNGDERFVGREAYWDPAAGVIAQDAIDGCDAVIHLAGEAITGRWTAAKMRRIEQSRVNGTRLIAEAIARSMHADRKSRMLLSASAVGFYGSRPGVDLDESEGAGSDFRAKVCRAWESAAEPARDAGARVVTMRIGLVIGARTPFMRPLLPVWRVGLGGSFGDGRQCWPWIGLDDLLGAVEFLLHRDDVNGPVNLTAPASTTNREFARTLARVLKRPALGFYPAWALRAIFGRLADEALLSDQRVIPGALERAGFVFLTPTLEACLRWELGLVTRGDLELLQEDSQDRSSRDAARANPLP
jgi:uncharacterized protein (TIGR01777 family)